nr:hypothetical protein [Tanacetum cinerariifolium]
MTSSISTLDSVSVSSVGESYCDCWNSSSWIRCCRLSIVSTSRGSRDSLAEEAKTESNGSDDGSENVNPFSGGNPRFHDEHRDNSLLTKETESEPIIWDVGDEEEGYPFVNKHPGFKEEPIMLVEEQSCPVYDTDNEENEDGDEDEVVNADYKEALVFDDDQYKALVFDDDDQYEVATATVQILTSVDFYDTIADRGNEEDGLESRAREDRFYYNRRSTDRGNEKVDHEPRFNEDEVDNDEGDRLFLEQSLRWIPECVLMARNDGSIFTFDDIERNEGEKGLVEGDGPTMVTGRLVASMATLLFMPKVQRKSDEATNGVMEPHANNDTMDFDLYVKNEFFNKIGLADCGPQDQMGRKDYDGPTTTFLDVLNSLTSKIATTKCVGPELFERFKLIAKSDRSNAFYDPGGTGITPGETTSEVKLFRQVMVTLINGSRVDVPFDPGDFAPKAKLEDEFFRREGE